MKGISIKSKRDLIKERDNLVEKAKSAESLLDSREAILNYQLAAKISQEVGDFEKARQLQDTVNEFKRRVQLVKKKSLTNRKIMVDESTILTLNKEASQALEIAIIAEEEHRWIDALAAYKIVVQKNNEAGDNERAKAYEEKIKAIERIIQKERQN